MNPIEELKLALLWEIPLATSEIRTPRNPDGVWILDIGMSDRKVIVEWSPKHGFGVSPERDDVGYGEGPEEVFEDLHAAYLRTLELLTGQAECDTCCGTQLVETPGVQLHFSPCPDCSIPAPLKPPTS